MTHHHQHPSQPWQAPLQLQVPAWPLLLPRLLLPPPVQQKALRSLQASQE
jgi:hypothetical protein